MAQSYTGPIFSGQPDWARVPIARLESFHWEKESPYRPASFAQLCAVRGEGIFVRMWSFESPIRAVAAKRDDPVYQDSCLECFLNPFPAQQNSYINFEMNPNGVFLTEFGSEREGRERLSRLTEQSPSVTPFTLPSPQGDAWGVLLFVPCELVESLYHQPFSLRQLRWQAIFINAAMKRRILILAHISQWGVRSSAFITHSVSGG